MSSNCHGIPGDSAFAFREHPLCVSCRLELISKGVKYVLVGVIVRVYIENIRVIMLWRTDMVRSDDRGKFVELASKRVSKALKDIQLIGNLSNRSNYDYTDADVTKIFRALQDELATCKKKFEAAGKKPGDQPRFVLD
jgi:hypothetical protein